MIECRYGLCISCNWDSSFRYNRRNLVAIEWLKLVFKLWWKIPNRHSKLISQGENDNAKEENDKTMNNLQNTTSNLNWTPNYEKKRGEGYMMPCGKLKMLKRNKLKHLTGKQTKPKLTVYFGYWIYYKNLNSGHLS